MSFKKDQNIEYEITPIEIKKLDYDNKDDSNLILDKEVSLIKDKKNFNYFNIIICLFIIVICLFLTYMFFIPRIKLTGDKNMTILYNQEYIEPGYKGVLFNKDITKNIIVSDNIVSNKIGKYQVLYKYGIIKKKRYVNIIDNVKPDIILESDVLNICPREDINNIKFSAYDEYDGDITKNIISREENGKLYLSVVDSSNNKCNKVININRSDTTKPDILLKGDKIIYLEGDCKYKELGYSANDICDGDITDKVLVEGSVGNKPGKYKIIYSVSDKAGNSSSIERTVIRKNKIVHNSGKNESGTIYLTFDDGPREDTTKYILDILKEEGVSATFFVTCSGPDYLIKRAYQEGHTVALHTATHDYGYVYSSVDNYYNDLNKVRKRVRDITGVDSKIVRFPGGSSNTVSRKYKYGIMSELTNSLISNGYRYYDWNVDSDDAGGAHSSIQVYNNVVNNLSINRMNMVLMHDVKNQTMDALRNIIKYGKEHGYSFKKIDMDTQMIRHHVNN